MILPQIHCLARFTLLFIKQEKNWKFKLIIFSWIGTLLTVSLRIACHIVFTLELNKLGEPNQSCNFGPIYYISAQLDLILQSRNIMSSGYQSMQEKCIFKVVCNNVQFNRVWNSCRLKHILSFMCRLCCEHLNQTHYSFPLVNCRCASGERRAGIHS